MTCIFYYWGDPDFRQDRSVLQSTCNNINQIPAKAGISFSRPSDCHPIIIGSSESWNPLDPMKFHLKLSPDTIDYQLSTVNYKQFFYFITRSISFNKYSCGSEKYSQKNIPASLCFRMYLTFIRMERSSS